MIILYDNDSGARLGEITEEQFAFLQSQLEEESAADQDYYLPVPVIDMIEQRGGDPALVALLRGALGGRQSLEIRWEQSA